MGRLEQSNMERKKYRSEVDRSLVFKGSSTLPTTSIIIVLIDSSLTSFLVPQQILKLAAYLLAENCCPHGE